VEGMTNGWLILPSLVTNVLKHLNQFLIAFEEVVRDEHRLRRRTIIETAHDRVCRLKTDSPDRNSLGGLPSSCTNSFGNVADHRTRMLMTICFLPRLENKFLAPPHA
jgi:hypothetical protein